MATVKMKYMSLAMIMACGSLVAQAAQQKQAAVADLVNPEGKKVGTAHFEAVKGGVRIDLSVSDLTPGEHGIHIHEVGKCDAPLFKGAGEHFEPMKREHGLENPKGAHAGDLPNLVVKEDGSAKMDVITRTVTLGQGKDSLFKKGGTSLVIHNREDDQKSQPTGDSGSRIACGVIRQGA